MGNLRRWARLTAAVVGLTVLGLYGAALIFQELSFRRASRLLDKMDRLRLGDPAENAELALAFCSPSRFPDGFGCRMMAGPFSHFILWENISKVLGRSNANALPHELQWIGIRAWMVDANVHVEHGRVVELSVNAWVEGQEYPLMARCVRRAELLFRSDGQAMSDEDRRTLIRRWGGLAETLVVILTPMSTEKELKAGIVNRECLAGFGGCSALCELLPGSTPVLDDRRQGYGGCVDRVSTVKCHPKADPICR